MEDKKFLVRIIGTENYYGEYCPVGTNRENATRVTREEAEGFVERSKTRNNGVSKVEFIEE